MSFDFPCNTFSRARKNDGKGPGPLRDDDKWIMGLPNLTEKDKKRVQEANVMLKHTVALMRFAIKNKVPILLENPASSRLWLTPQITALFNETTPAIVPVDYCQYDDNPWRKPTKFIAWNWPKLKLHTCTPGRICSRTGKPHIELSGKIGNTFKTKLAEPYPPTMCSYIANSLTNNVFT